MSPWQLVPTSSGDLDELVELCAAFHAFEQIEQAPEDTRRIIQTLLEDPLLGSIWFIQHRAQTAGYLALCLGYSLETGRDAFVDELYLRPEFRGQGGGTAALSLIEPMLATHEVKALHLEVARGNEPARALYEKFGFKASQRYTLMTKML